MVRRIEGPRADGTAGVVAVLVAMAVGGIALLWFIFDGWLLNWEPQCQPDPPEWRCEWGATGREATVEEQRNEDLPVALLLLGISILLVMTPVVMGIRALLRRRDDRFEARLRGEDQRER